MSKFNKILLFFNVVIVIVIVIVAIANAWTNPSSNPPSGGAALYYSGGNVGVGTASPGAKLTVSSADDTSSAIYVVNSSGVNRFALNPLSTGAWTLYDYAGGVWNAGMTQKSGNIGIGTTNPTAKLTVGGTVGIDGIKFPDGTLQTTAAVSSIPSGAVMFFNLSACPSGWSELISARGRYLVGLPSGGTLTGTAGTALSNLENRPVGQHSHSINDPGHSHAYIRGNDYPFEAPPGGMVYMGGGYWNWSSSELTRITINNAGTVAGTNAPYIQLLVCQKQ